LRPVRCLTKTSSRWSQSSRAGPRSPRRSWGRARRMAARCLCLHLCPRRRSASAPLQWVSALTGERTRGAHENRSTRLWVDSIGSMFGADVTELRECTDNTAGGAMGLGCRTVRTRARYARVRRRTGDGTGDWMGIGMIGPAARTCVRGRNIITILSTVICDSW